jgi:dTDP-glucose pyrophosphorylase
VTRIVEKPAPGTSTTHWNSAGLYSFRPAIFDELARIPLSPRGEYELPSAMAQLLHAGRKLLLYPIRGAWRDIGRPEDIAIAEKLLLNQQV